ncbi:MAG: GntR family transcriptional regulator [Planctomycetota bacterium]|jgi:DNA-binding transcriptional regulator YhcF (GntR family)
MALAIKFDRVGDIPAYVQVVEGITALIEGGDLKAGDKLPSERDLAEELGIARGTIKQAYSNLEKNHLIEVTRGRGTFVSSRQNVVPVQRKERAVALIDDLLKELVSLDFSHREIRNLMDLKIMEREALFENLFIAAIDCNPEALDIYERQIGFLSHVNIVKILLDDLGKEEDPTARLANYKVILATSTHYSELIQLVPGLTDRVLQVVVSPNHQTILRLAKITTAQRIGIISLSKKFRKIIRGKLREFKIAADHIATLEWKDGTDLKAFLEDRDVIIVPPVFDLQREKCNINPVLEFRQRGGTVIPFDFQIERGSLLQIEERLRDLLTV